MKKLIYSVFTVLSLGLIIIFPDSASAKTTSEEIKTPTTLNVQPTSIYQNAKEIQLDKPVYGSTTRYSRSSYYKVYVGINDGYPSLVFNTQSDDSAHEIFVYGENYLSVGNKQNYDTVYVNGAYGWYYVEIRARYTSTFDLPFKLTVASPNYGL